MRVRRIDHKCIDTEGYWDGTWDESYEWVIEDEEGLEVAGMDGYHTKEKAVEAGEKKLKELEEVMKARVKSTGEIVEVFVDDDSDTPITYNIYKDGECVCHHHGKYWSVKEWSEALSEGLRAAVKILKEK